MKAKNLVKNKEYQYLGNGSTTHVVFKQKTVNGYLFEGLLGDCKASAELTAGQVDQLIA